MFAHPESDLQKLFLIALIFSCCRNLGFFVLMYVVRVWSVRKGVQLQESERYVMRARGTTLTVRNIQQDDGGSYTCKASNKAGEVEHELFLKVFGENSFFYWVTDALFIESK